MDNRWELPPWHKQRRRLADVKSTKLRMETTKWKERSTMLMLIIHQHRVQQVVTSVCVVNEAQYVWHITAMICVCYVTVPTTPGKHAPHLRLGRGYSVSWVWAGLPGAASTHTNNIQWTHRKMPLIYYEGKVGKSTEFYHRHVRLMRWMFGWHTCRLDRCILRWAVHYVWLRSSA